MSTPKEIIRDGWILNCPFCKREILYTHFINWSVPTPFFYSDESNDVLLRKSDEKKVQELFDEKQPNSKPTIVELESLWKKILIDAPPAPNGGRFSFWANVKCPHCDTEIPYNNGNRDLNVRINDSKIVLINDAIVVGDSEEDTWEIRVRIDEGGNARRVGDL